MVMASLYWRIKDKRGNWKFVPISAYTITVEPYGTPMAGFGLVKDQDELLNWAYQGQEDDMLCHCRSCQNELHSILYEESLNDDE